MGSSLSLMGQGFTIITAAGAADERAMVVVLHDGAEYDKNLITLA